VVKAPSIEHTFGGIGVGMDEIGPLKRGVRAHFPPSTCGFVPVEADGVFVPDATVITGETTHPIRFTVEGGYITNIEGEWEAEAVRRFINGPGRDPAPKRLVECMWGLNPKARLTGANATFVEKERHAGVLHLGVATYQIDDNYNADALQKGTGVWVSHVDTYIQTPTMWFNGERMVDNRKLLLLEDPDLINFAKQIGDPEELLQPGQPMDNITC